MGYHLNHCRCGRRGPVVSAHPVIFTKQKIKEHLRKVYEKHKDRGQGRPKEDEGEAAKGDNVVKYAEEGDKDAVVGYAVQDIAAAEKEDPAMRKKDSAEPSKGGNPEVTS